ncbi:hypothetical protein N7509_009635 [Penicillium cosmopolitanum]|uniref:Uncharacterized protein n=1 Tax=Penicillium cosmopolitanum TaxID=1131564 RepID=A0A9X0B3S4_9EURO|nr:uncharacterized protein N7509_009635 [Penicillium cosmopolitanum]KAJ5387094.1 hypothetical protein N7509_009635 [Penicillium cosmopolitanum]
MSNFFRRASDVFKHQPRNDSIDSANSGKSPPTQDAPDPKPVSSNRSSQSDPVPATLPDNDARRKSQRHWGFGRQNDPEALKKRRASQDEKDRLDFAAASKYSSARRRSQGAGTGFEGGWQ